MDVNFVAVDLATGDYVAAAFDVVGILVPGGTGFGKIGSDAIERAVKFFGKNADDVADVARHADSVWNLKPFDRGWELERIFGGMGNNFPVIDKFTQGAGKIASSVTSIKSLDVTAKSYQSGKAVYNRIMKYVDQLAGFTQGRLSELTVGVDADTIKILELIIPPGATDEQIAQIMQAVIDAAEQGIEIITHVVQ